VRFRLFPKLLSSNAKILCCGARQGTEVDVLRDLGFANARGIDLNPGRGNPLVTTGDMMKLDLPNDSLDLLYTNCVDHAFDLDQMIMEHARVLKSDGYLLYDIGINIEEGGGPFEAISWERTEDVVLRLLESFRSIIRIERERQWLWVLVQGKQRV
jgi:SAM-dependent methyltransferase